MKYNLKLTAIILGMFILTQFIGLYVIHLNLDKGISLPYGFEESAQTYHTESQSAQYSFLMSFIPAFIIAVLLIIILMKKKALILIRIWFFIVIIMAIGVTLSLFTKSMNYEIIYWDIPIFASLIALLLAYFKVFKRNILVHNLTELLIYPGIAAIFVTMLNLTTTIILLVIISIYDIWAVWHSQVMVKMAKFQINSVGVFGGFFIPYASKKIRDKIALLKLKYKDHKIPKSIALKHNLKVNLAILGGGDVVFPIIAAGVFFKTFHSWQATLCVVAGATLALLYLFIFAKKKKFYPAMPYLTTGILLGMLLGYFIFI